MLVSIGQPAYLPWLGYFDRIAKSDLHIVLDHVQFEKRSFTSRNKVRVKDGSCWLTVPVKTKGLFGVITIDKLEIVQDEDWARKHWQTLVLNYGKARYFNEHRNFFEEVYSRPHQLLASLMNEITTYLLATFQIKTKIFHSSELKVEGVKSDLILNLSKHVGATQYLSGPFGRDYLDHNSFTEVGIEILYHDYQHPTYSQYYPGFEPYMAAIDLLFNHGPESLNILTNAAPSTGASK